VARYEVISADSHVIEPGDLWLRYIDPEFRERAPRIVNRDGTDFYEAEGGEHLMTVPVAAAPGRPVKWTGTFEESVPPGGYDPRARVADMLVDGVDAEIVYPTIAMRIFSLDDADYRTACCRAYNRWVADFVAGAPERLKGIGMVSLHDPEAAAREVETIRAQGLSGVMVAIATGADTAYDSPFYDPFWAAARALGMPVSLHVFTERTKVAMIERRPVQEYALVFFDIQRTLCQLIFGGVFNRFPGVKVVSVENDSGWAPYFVERLEHVVYRLSSAGMGAQFTDRTPRECFQDNVRLTFIRDRTGLCAREFLGPETLMWSSDYPHSDGTWPKSREVIARIFTGIPEEERRRITAGNVAKLYAF
jgi:predicted TIM-barrel fold metal-dependent hydrolase